MSVAVDWYIPVGRQATSHKKDPCDYTKQREMSDKTVAGTAIQEGKVYVIYSSPSASFSFK